MNAVNVNFYHRKVILPYTIFQKHGKLVMPAP